VALNPAFAYPLAEVAAAVASAAPPLWPLVRARLAAATPLAVPRAVAAGVAPTSGAYAAAMGYRKLDPVDGAPPAWEPADAVAARVRGYILFMVAACVSDAAAAGGGAAHATGGHAAAWSFLARLLNALPPTRLAAVALDAALEAGGHALAGVYGRQFLKVRREREGGWKGVVFVCFFILPPSSHTHARPPAHLQLLSHVDAHFLPALAACGDPDARAPAARIRSYLHSGAFRSPPEGRTMPLSDASSYDRA
jgi:hypothetical protein